MSCAASHSDAALVPMGPSNDMPQYLFSLSTAARKALAYTGAAAGLYPPAYTAAYAYSYGYANAGMGRYI